MSSWIFFFPPNNDSNSNYANISRKLQFASGSMEQKRWKVSCKYFISMAPKEKSAGAGAAGGSTRNNNLIHKLFLLQGAHPETHYSNTSNSKASLFTHHLITEDRILAGNDGLEHLLGKIKSVYSYRQQSIIEGFLYQIGDFKVGFGSIKIGTAAEANQGLVLQIYYGVNGKISQDYTFALSLIQDLLGRDLAAAAGKSIIEYPYEQYGMVFNSTTDMDSRHIALQILTLIQANKLL